MVTFWPGLPADLPSMTTCPIPSGVMIWALAVLAAPPFCWANTVELWPVMVAGILNTTVTVPHLPALPVPIILAPAFPSFRNTETDEPGVKPLPSMVTMPPGDTMPGLAKIIGPPPAATGWPPIVTIGVLVGGVVGRSVGPPDVLAPPDVPDPWAAGVPLGEFLPELSRDFPTCQMTMITTMATSNCFQPIFDRRFFTGGFFGGPLRTG